MTRIAVIGSGTMGNGIAHVFAQHGHDVTLIDVSQAALDKALGTIKGTPVGTFAALEGDYAADSLQVYYRGKPLTNDPQSFRVLEFGYAVSKDRVYYQ